MLAPPIQLTLLTNPVNARQLDTIYDALEKLNLIVMYSYNRLTSDDKRHTKKAIKELHPSKTHNLMEWAKFQHEAQQ